MRILGIEFSSQRRSVALVEWRDGGFLRHGVAVADAGERAAPLAMVANVLAEAGATRLDVDRLAVGLGPGSYTGVRGAVSLAQGWQLAAGVETVGLSAPWCLAWQLHRGGRRGSVWTAIDAQRGEFYTARFNLADSGPREEEPLAIRPLSELVLAEAAGAIIAGPGMRQWLSGAIDLWPEAEALCALAGPGIDPAPAENLEPIYLRATSYVKAPPARRLDPH